MGFVIRGWGEIYISPRGLKRQHLRLMTELRVDKMLPTPTLARTVKSDRPQLRVRLRLLRLGSGERKMLEYSQFTLKNETLSVTMRKGRLRFALKMALCLHAGTTVG